MTDTGCTPLFKAIQQKHSEITKLLLDAGAKGDSSLFEAVVLNDVNLVEKKLCKDDGMLASDDEQVLANACFALSHLCEKDEHMDAVIGMGVVPRLVELLSHSSPKVQTPALRAIGHVVSGDATHTQAVIDANALPQLRDLLSVPSYQQSVCWALSNIAAGTSKQLQAVLDADVILMVSNLLTSEDTNMKEVKIEAAWVLANATMGGTPAQIEILVSMGVVEVLRAVIDVDGAKEPAMKGLERIKVVQEAKKKKNEENA